MEEGEIIYGDELPDEDSNDGEQDNTTRNIIIASIILLVLICCCCFLFISALAASGVFGDATQLFGQAIPL